MAPIVSSPEFDDNATAKEHDVRQLGERRNRILALRAFSQSDRVVLEGDGGVGLVVRAIERVNAGSVPSERDDRCAVGIEHKGSLVISLLRAGGNRLAGGFDCKSRRYPVHRQSVGN